MSEAHPKLEHTIWEGVGHSRGGASESLGAREGMSREGEGKGRVGKLWVE